MEIVFGSSSISFGRNPNQIHIVFIIIVCMGHSSLKMVNVKFYTVCWDEIVCLFVCFCGRPLSKELGIPIGILPTSGAAVDGNAPYKVNPGIQTNFLPPRPVQS